MSDLEKRRETRKQKAFARLGSEHPHCLTCTEKDQRCLEFHHLAGKDFDEFGINACRNCHGKLSDMQKDHPPKLGDPPTTFESIGHFLLGLADFLVRLADKLWEFGLYLIEQAKLQASKPHASRA